MRGERRCKICGCTENTACIKGGVPCAWVNGRSICSACFEVIEKWQKLENEKVMDWVERVDVHRKEREKKAQVCQVDKVDGVDGVKTVGFRNINDRTVWIRELGQTAVEPGEEIWIPEDIAERLLHENYFRASFERVK